MFHWVSLFLFVLILNSEALAQKGHPHHRKCPYEQVMQILSRAREVSDREIAKLAPTVGWSCETPGRERSLLGLAYVYACDQGKIVIRIENEFCKPETVKVSKIKILYSSEKPRLENESESTSRIEFASRMCSHSSSAIF